MINIAEPTKQELSAALAQFPEANFFQSWQWGEVHESLGRTVIRRILKNDDEIIGVWSGNVRDAKRGRYLEVPGGPLLDWYDHEAVQIVMKNVIDEAKKQRCVFVRFRPQLEDSAEAEAIMRSVGAHPAPMHIAADHTSIVNITLPLDDLLANMRQQTRYEVRRSAKRDLVIAATSGTEAIDEFYDLQAETAKRQSFIPPTKRELQTYMRCFGDNAKMYTVSKNGQTLNIALVLFFGGEVVYYEAASTVEARKEPGAYALIWRIIQDAKNAGFTSLNLWGIAPPGRENHRFAGVTTFKRGFGGNDVAFVPAQDIAIAPLRYAATNAFEKIRKKKRGL